MRRRRCWPGPRAFSDSAAGFFGLELTTPVLLFYLALASSLVAAYVAWRLEESRLGRAWTAIRDDEDVAQALGINLIRVKLLAYGLGAAFAGLAGSIFATMLGIHLSRTPSSSSSRSTYWR